MPSIPGSANRLQLLAMLRERRTCTRSEAAAELGVSLPTAAACLDDLIAAGLAEADGEEPSRGGRRAGRVRFLSRGACAAGFDVEPDGCRGVLLDLDLKPLGSWRRDFRSVPAPVALARILRGGLQTLVRRAGLDNARLLGAGLSLPGVIDPREARLSLAPNLGYRDLPLARLTDGLGTNALCENEANAAALAEMYLGSPQPEPVRAAGAARSATLVYLSITAGVGAGIVIDGRLMRGLDGRAGEFGHMIIEAGGRPCACGRSGCWERYASEAVLVQALAECTGEAVKSVNEVAALLARPRGEVGRVWSAWLDYLALGILNVLACVDPDRVVIGGDLVSLGSLLAEPLRERLRARGLSEDGLSRVGFSSLGRDASMLGAALMPLASLFPLLGASF